MTCRDTVLPHTQIYTYKHTCAGTQLGASHYYETQLRKAITLRKIIAYSPAKQQFEEALENEPKLLLLENY